MDVKRELTFLCVLSASLMLALSQRRLRLEARDGKSLLTAKARTSKQPMIVDERTPFLTLYET